MGCSTNILLPMAVHTMPITFLNTEHVYHLNVKKIVKIKKKKYTYIHQQLAHIVYLATTLSVYNTHSNYDMTSI